jgi:hypothetical protein
VPLPPSLAQLLWQRQATLKPKPDALVWSNQHGNSLDPANLASRVLKPAPGLRK